MSCWRSCNGRDDRCQSAEGSACSTQSYVNKYPAFQDIADATEAMAAMLAADMPVKSACGWGSLLNLFPLMVHKWAEAECFT